MQQDETNFNPDTVGTAKPTPPSPTLAGNTFGDAIEHLRNGGMVAREGWNGKGMYVFKQVPSTVPANIVPKMSSLPDGVKEYMVVEARTPRYRNQMAITTPDGYIDSWVASSSDTFATDWILF